MLVWFGSVGVIDTLGYNNKKIRKQSQAVDVYVSHSVFMNYAPDVLLGLIIIFQNAGVDYLTFDCLFDVLNTQIDQYTELKSSPVMEGQTQVHSIAGIMIDFHLFRAHVSTHIYTLT